MFLSLFFFLSLKIVRSNRMSSTWQPAALPLSYSSSAKRFFFFLLFLTLKVSYIYTIYIDRINLLPPPTCATYLIYLSISWLKIFVNSPVSLIIAIHVCVDMGHPLGHEQPTSGLFLKRRPSRAYLEGKTSEVPPHSCWNFDGQVKPHLLWVDVCSCHIMSKDKHSQFSPCVSLMVGDWYRWPHL